MDTVDAREHHVWELEDWKERVEVDGIDEVGPFMLVFAPDVYHKVNVSGGGPYGIVLPDDKIDGRVNLDGREMYFVDYIRECFEWGGFPGFASMDKGRDAGTVSRLSTGLLPI